MNIEMFDKQNKAAGGGGESSGGERPDKDSILVKEASLPSNGSKPLADRIRPQRLEEIFGQEHLVAPGQPFRKLIESDRVRSFVLWGPPGTGKTTLARIVALHTERRFVAISAVMSGVKDIKEEVQNAKFHLAKDGKSTILFVDEIHRFNKSQQDALLPHVEDGTLTLIGATTENPSFELNSALLSRAQVFILKSLDLEQLQALLRKALIDPARGLGGMQISFPERWIFLISSYADGDARKALTALERAALFLEQSKHLEKEELEKESSDHILFETLGSKKIRFDATGEEHYNCISAFIKSMRDSDPDAAVYYLARMLEGGEDPLFIVRRMVVFASEDVGNADPRALQIALTVKDAVEFVGLPEARINLAQGVTYLSSCPKSNASYRAIEDALAEVQSSGALGVPMHLRNAVTGLMKNIGYGKGYQYAHDFKGTNQINLPEELKHKRFYKPKDSGLEKQIAERLEIKKKLQKID